MFSLNRACCTLHSMVVVAQAEFNDVVHGQQPFFIDHVYQVGSKQQDMINKTNVLHTMRPTLKKTICGHCGYQESTSHSLIQNTHVWICSYIALEG